MRRKSSRNTRNSSPEKTKSESQRRSRRQSSKRRKRSSSRSSEDSDEQQHDVKDSVQVPVQNSAACADISLDQNSRNSEKPVESLLSDNKRHSEAIVHSTVESLSPERKSSASGEEYNPESNKEYNKDSKEDMEEKKNKGKSKGKNKSNFEPSSNNIEPETENENVQGTPQSPSNDYADNENVVQNVHDTAKFNLEAQESDKVEDIKVSENEDQQQRKLEEVSFVSEYSQINEASREYEDIPKPDQVSEGVTSERVKSHFSLERNEQSSFQSSISVTEERSTTPELRTNKVNTCNKDASESNSNVTLPNEGNNKFTCREISGSKKKITLKRSPPESNETVSNVPENFAQKPSRSSSIEENEKTGENKPSKKITLKRHTTDSNTSEVHADNKNENVSRSLSEDSAEKQRRYSLGDDKEQEREENAKQEFKPIKLIRNVSRDSVENEEEKTRRIALRRQKWSRSDWLNKLTSSFYKIDVDSIKIVCPGLEFLGENEVNLEPTPKERKKSESEPKRKVSIDNRSEDSDRPDYEKQTSEDSSGEPKIEPNPNIIAMNRKISIVDDTASKLRPPPSPAKNPTSDVLFITNLVRPFTVKQLKELLERTGTIKDDGFWTDRIKSKCYVQYESAEQAEATRNALHGVHWPIGNGKKLVIDYATVEDLQKAKNPTPTPLILPEKLPEKENREPDRGDVKFKEGDREERRKRDAPVREWDLGKEDSRRRFSRSRSRERARKHSRRSYTPEGYFNNKKQRKADDSVPQKLMDDLFLKTKATPSIYWQPLSPEEIVTKQQQRLVRMEEHKRRIEENRGRVRDGRRGMFRRR